MFRKILVATDLTSKSHNALRLAVSLARQLSATLFSLHVVPLPAKLRIWSPLALQDHKSYQLILRTEVAAAEVELKNQISAMRWTSKDVRPIVEVGDPSKTIAKVAEELGVDVIVVARGSGGLLGSVAEQVVRLAGQTVLVAPVKWRRRMNAFIPLPVSAGRTRRGASIVAAKSVKNK